MTLNGRYRPIREGNPQQPEELREIYSPDVADCAAFALGNCALLVSEGAEAELRRILADFGF